MLIDIDAKSGPKKDCFRSLNFYLSLRKFLLLPGVEEFACSIEYDKLPWMHYVEVSSLYPIMSDKR